MRLGYLHGGAGGEAGLLTWWGRRRGWVTYMVGQEVRLGYLHGGAGAGDEVPTPDAYVRRSVT